jgi:hypothetical protein
MNIMTPVTKVIIIVIVEVSILETKPYIYHQKKTSHHKTCTDTVPKR